jgi:hypothetical protein
MVAEGDTIVTEHTEDWYFPTGEIKWWIERVSQYSQAHVSSD